MALSVGSKAPTFNLPSAQGGEVDLQSLTEPVIVVVFTCNHCPYAKAYESRLVDIQKRYEHKGVRFLAINPNNAVSHPEDSFEQMQLRAVQKGFNFPYLRDESQSVARAYQAQFTPEVFVLDQHRMIRYHGRIDDNYSDPNQVQSPDLIHAIEALLAGKEPPVRDTTPVGCTIKWK